MLHNIYSVHSRLIREKVEVRVYAEHLEVRYAQRRVELLPRLRGEEKHRIDYRHIIDWLVRKPGAFANYRYKGDLFPTSRFRIAYDILKEQSPVHADKEYVNPADDIQVTATLDKDEYLPSEKARIEFQVTPAQPAAPGITIVDEAVYALQENRPGLLKVYFSMEEDTMKPRFWPLIVPFEEAVTSESHDEEVQEMAEIVFASAEEPDASGIDESSYPDLIQKMKETLESRIAKDAKDVVEHLRDLNI